MIRIVITGSECTGKTSLARALAEHFKVPWLPEVVRDFVAEINRPLMADDVDLIARRFVEMSRALECTGAPMVIHDTDLTSTWIYAHHYYGQCPKWIDHAIATRPGDLYLLAGLDVPWVPDAGQRDRGHMREAMQALFRHELQRRSLEYVEIQGSIRERLAQAIPILESRLRNE